MKAYFVSDIHLKSSTEPSALALERLLRGILSDAATTHLFLVGDIFDLWIGSHAYFRERFESLTDLVREVVRRGVEVHFFEGNHDLHLADFWAAEIGVQVHADAEVFALGNRTVRVEHGDLMNPHDKGYLFLRRLLRFAPVRMLALNLPARLVTKIGERASQASRTYTSTAKELPRAEIEKVIHDHAARAYLETPFDLIVSGHVHVRDDFTFLAADGREVRSINLGSWFEKPSAFVLTEQRAEFTEAEFA